MKKKENDIKKVNLSTQEKITKILKKKKIVKKKKNLNLN